MGSNGLRLLVGVYNEAWNGLRVPRDWEVGVIVPTFKKDDKITCREKIRNDNEEETTRSHLVLKRVQNGSRKEYSTQTTCLRRKTN